MRADIHNYCEENNVKLRSLTLDRVKSETSRRSLLTSHEIQEKHLETSAKVSIYSQCCLSSTSSADSDKGTAAQCIMGACGHSTDDPEYFLLTFLGDEETCVQAQTGLHNIILI